VGWAVVVMSEACIYFALFGWGVVQGLKPLSFDFGALRRE
jgi:hypothetical protein